jgi:hypothetical protein
VFVISGRSKVATEIGRFRRRWFVPVLKAGSLAELNARLAEANAAEDARHVAGRAATIGEDFAAERSLLLPLPPEPFATAAVLWPRVDRYGQRGQMPVFGAGPADRIAGPGDAVGQRAACLRRPGAGCRASAADRGRR